MICLRLDLAAGSGYLCSGAETDSELSQGLHGFVALTPELLEAMDTVHGSFGLNHSIDNRFELRTLR